MEKTIGDIKYKLVEAPEGRRHDCFGCAGEVKGKEGLCNDLGSECLLCENEDKVWQEVKADA